MVPEKAAKDLRAQVFAIEAAMLEMPQLELPVKHHFAGGVYARELHIPAGTVLTGAIHKYPQINILSQGDISVLTEAGIVRVQAPFTIASPAGTKRIAYAHTDCVWTTLHATEETNLEVIEAHFIAQSEQEYVAFCQNALLESH